MDEYICVYIYISNFFMYFINVCMYIHMGISGVYIYMYVSLMHVYEYVNCIDMYMYIYIYVYMPYIYILNIYLQVYVSTYIHMFKYMYTFLYTCICKVSPIIRIGVFGPIRTNLIWSDSTVTFGPIMLPSTVVYFTGLTLAVVYFTL
jgi:hypothetical protein